jgi:hypothetical protein
MHFYHIVIPTPFGFAQGRLRGGISSETNTDGIFRAEFILSKAEGLKMTSKSVCGSAARFILTFLTAVRKVRMFRGIFGKKWMWNVIEALYNER